MLFRDSSCRVCRNSYILSGIKMKLLQRLEKYRFEFRHFTVLFIILLAFQGALSFIHNASLRTFMVKTQNWYQRNSAEKLANVTTTSLELLTEAVNLREPMSPSQRLRVTDALNIVLSQELLAKNAKDICILVSQKNKVYAIDEGGALLNYLLNSSGPVPSPETSHEQAIQLYSRIRRRLQSKEEIVTILQGRQTFNVFVPFSPHGEFVGAVYMKDTPNFSFITGSIISSYNETSVIYTSLILLGLLAMYYVSAYTIKERDKAQKLFFEERENLVKERTTHEREYLYTKRIYHTHHKAEKVMAFIKEDLKLLTSDNIDEVKYRISKYSNFISRVIYDMKWFDPPIHIFRGDGFNTDINGVIEFIVKNMFQRVAIPSNNISFKLEFCRELPTVHVNEFVVWEIVEPLIQNSIDHGGEGPLTITVKTEFDREANLSRIIVSDNGKGIAEELLSKNQNGVQNLFVENVSTKRVADRNYGYGCYIAYDLATVRCGWTMYAENLPEGGCSFVITIKNQAERRNVQP